MTVLLYAHEVDDGGSAGHDREVDDEGGRGGGGDKALVQVIEFLYFDNITVMTSQYFVLC